jgi:diguanylate cyclase (GGDEF)-like protein
MNQENTLFSREATVVDLESRLQELQRVHEPIWVYDFDHACIPWANKESLSIWQAESLDALCNRDLSSDMTQTVARRLKQYQTDFSRDENIQFKEMWTLYPNGEPQTLEVLYSAFRLGDGRMAMMCEATSKENHDNEALRSAEALLHTSVMITLYSTAGVPLYRNPAARSAACAFSESLQDHFVKPETMELLSASDHEEVNTVACVHTANGKRWHDITARRCMDAVSGDSAWLISEVDVSKLKATEERAQFLAEHDTLTGLPNRNYVSVAFQSKIRQMQEAKGEGAVIYIDLDHFKDVNDSLGHEAGDRLLVEVATRLKNIAGASDKIARLGGDEFLLLTHGDRAKAQALAGEIRLQLSHPIELQGRKIHTTPSIGISLFPKDGRNINDLMRHADLAMYHAKEQGRNDYAFFSRGMSEAVEKRINLESELMEALQEGQFETYFQPRVDVQSNEITGAEALVRWMHPQRGMVSPADFIPACEASGQICALGKFVLKQSVFAQQAWANNGHQLKVSVNLSPLQFAEDNLVDELKRIVEENHGDPRSIELEITESVLLGNDQSTVDKLHALVDYGFRIAIDDFGTGYSNLAYLHRYPIRCLKIDRSFITQLETAQPIVELIISMARLFKLDVVAEGVETQEQLSALQGYDCQEYQGFLFERPIDFRSFSKLLYAQEKSIAA